MLCFCLQSLLKGSTLLTQLRRPSLYRDSIYKEVWHLYFDSKTYISALTTLA